ncbi:MAG: class I SAM-dependent methyltransferase [Sandaracinaceae bacterium]
MSLSSGVTSVAYGAQQLSMLLPVTVAQRALRRWSGRPAPTPTSNQVRVLHRRLRGLYERDLANAEAGLYPRRLLFSTPLIDYAKHFPELMLDLPRVLRRRRKEGWRELPDDASPRDYPPYFRRTFHWQTDGYLSRRSARLYDVGVEFLFAGTAAVMRRQVIPPVTRFLQAREGGTRGARLLDVACGTGRLLAQMAETHPDLKLYGLDLSPYYVQEARANLDAVADVSLVAENAEAMPFAAGLFDMVTSVYLFHELPKNARRRVFAEMLRVLRPGGLLVIEDSAQLAEADEIRFFLERFPEDFHEPFYRDYLKDDLAAALRETGFVDVEVDPCFVAKVVTARKPA